MSCSVEANVKKRSIMLDGKVSRKEIRTEPRGSGRMSGSASMLKGVRYSTGENIIA